MNKKERVKELLLLLVHEDLENEPELQQELDDLVENDLNVLLEIAKEETNSSLSLTAMEEFARLTDVQIVSTFNKYKNHEDESARIRAIDLLNHIDISVDEKETLKKMYENETINGKVSILWVLENGTDNEYFQKQFALLKRNLNKE